MVASPGLMRADHRHVRAEPRGKLTPGEAVEQGSSRRKNAAAMAAAKMIGAQLRNPLLATC
jgi:hypothetical protein